jgi:hypothetical protein
VANRNPTPKPGNLVPWKPGQSGNPSGGSKKRRLASVLRDLMSEPAAGDSARTVAERWLIDIINGSAKTLNVALIRELLDRHDGPIPPPEPPPENMADKPDEELEAIAKGKRRRRA